MDSLLDGDHDDGSGSECSDNGSDREAAFKYSVDDIGDIMVPPPNTTSSQQRHQQQPFSATTANHASSTVKGGGMGTAVMDEDDAFGLNPAFVFGV